MKAIQNTSGNFTDTKTLMGEFIGLLILPIQHHDLHCGTFIKDINRRKNGWAISLQKMEQWDKEGRLYFPKSKGGRIQRKRYLDELKGKPVSDFWDDIGQVASQANERVDYPTQKPEALLDRIIKASSNKGDLVADFFCGSGTTAAVAEKLGRKWIVSDLGKFAIHTTRKRMIGVQRELKGQGPRLPGV